MLTLSEKVFRCGNIFLHQDDALSNKVITTATLRVMPTKPSVLTVASCNMVETAVAHRIAAIVMKHSLHWTETVFIIN